MAGTPDKPAKSAQFLAETRAKFRPGEPIRHRSIEDLSALVNERLQELRRLSNPRTRLPNVFAKVPLLRTPLVERSLLKVANYLSQPTRFQALIVAECLEAIRLELEAMNDG